MKTQTPHYANENGRIVCKNHAGNYLRGVLHQKPNAKKISTPSDYWEKLNDEEMIELAEIMGIVCEDCRVKTKNL